MKRVEFTLSMPGRASWDGRWSGEDQRFAVVRTVSDLKARELTAGPAYWNHAWNDGWCAAVSARIMQPGERRKKSAGFNGYEWMVDNIIDHGTTYDVDAKAKGCGA